MAIGLDNALQIAKSSLFLNQYRINVIGQNIANADNENYTKKSVLVDTNPPIKEISPGSIGTGVNVKEVTRLIDKFLEMNITSNLSELGQYEISNKYLKNIESIFNDLKNSGLGDKLNEFWNAWYDLSNNPSSTPERNAVIEKAVNLSSIFHYTDNELENVQKMIDLDISDTVDKINDITKEIAKLNQEIFNIEVNPQNNANDLRDKRDNLVKELSKYINIKYIEEDNKYIIYTGNGKTLVNGTVENSLKVEPGSIDNSFYKIYWISSSGKKEDITTELKSGELKGLVDVRDNYIGFYKNKLGQIANSLITEVNKIFSQGIGLEPFQQIISNVRVNNPDLSFNYSGLSNAVQQGNLSIVVYDVNGNPVEYKNLVIGDPESNNPLMDNDINNLKEFMNEINNINHLNASIINNKLHISADEGFKFAFSDDNTGLLSGLGINTFFNEKKYDLSPSVNIVATEDQTNSDHLIFTGYYDKSLLTGHEYEIEYNNGNLTIKDLFTGETLDKSKYKIYVVDNHLTIKFDGIKLQLDNSSWTGNNKFHINTINSSSIYDDNLVDNHTYRIDFSQGDNSISITDLDNNRTLMDNEFQVSDIDVDNDGVIDFKSIKIKSTGLTITITNNSFGTIEIKPKIVGAKYIDTNFNENDVKSINAGKVNSIEVDDSQSSTSIHNIEVTNFNLLTRTNFNIIALGGGTYQITDEQGNNITPTAQGANFVEFQGIRINFNSSTNNGDLIKVSSNLLDYSNGDNRIALKISNLRDEKVMDNGVNSITDSYSLLLTKIGIDKKYMSNRLDATKIREEGLKQQRNSISGVSIDEEMTKLIQTQHAYIASSKLISIIDKLTEHIINTI